MLASVSCGWRPACGTVPDHVVREVPDGGPPGLGAGRGRARGAGAPLRRGARRRDAHAVPHRLAGRRWAHGGSGRPAVRRSPDTVWRVLHRYQAEGPDGVPHRRRPGHRGRIPAAWEAELRRVIELDPRAVGVPSAVWTTGLLAAYLAAATGHRVHLETVRRHLHQADYVCKRPGWSLKRKAQEQPEWAKNG